MAIESDQIKTGVLGAGGPPTGSVTATASTSVPTGYLVCDGSAVSRTTYADLFTEIGITHGDGDGSTTFNLPDYRGRFLRGFDNGAGNDPDSASRTASGTNGNTGDNIGSYQADENKSHLHIGGTRMSWVTTAGMEYGSVSTTSGSQYQVGLTTGATILANTSNEGATDSRPKNINVNYIIKY